MLGLQSVADSTTKNYIIKRGTVTAESENTYSTITSNGNGRLFSKVNTAHKIQFSCETNPDKIQTVRVNSSVDTGVGHKIKTVETRNGDLVGFTDESLENRYILKDL